MASGLTVAAEVTCSRCQNTRSGLDRSPYPGELGARLLASVCNACYREWLDVQLMVINEYRLSPFDPQARALIEGHMRTFFHLDGPPLERPA